MDTPSKNDEKKQSSDNGFWKRQFIGIPTYKQNIFDGIFGIVLPIACLIGDPVVFKADVGRPMIPSNYIIICYWLIFLAILSLVICLQYRPKSLILSAILLLGSIISFVIGVNLLPLSVFALLIVIGIFGFTPLFTGFVYLRNAYRTFIACRNQLTAKQIILAITTITLITGIPMFAQVYANHEAQDAFNNILAGDIEKGETSIKRLKWLKIFVDTDELAWQYEQIDDSQKQQLIAKAYKELTGEDIEERLNALYYYD